jgi:DNA-binding beta-propeller fold protein YncE
VKFQFGVTAQGYPLFNHPTDIAIDSAGKLYVTDPLNYRVRIFSPAGLQLNEIGHMGDAPGDMNKPKGVGIDSEGHIYVADALLDEIQVFDGNGDLLLTFGQVGTGSGAFWMPSGIWVDRHDYIFVADTYNQRIQVFRYLPDDGLAPDVRTGEPRK